MSWFQQPTGAPEPAKPLRPPVWMGPSDNELGVALGLRFVLASSSQAWVLVTDAVAYSNGFEVAISARTRQPVAGMPGMLHGPLVPGRPLPPELLRLGIEFADGRRATSLGRMPPPGPPGSERREPDGPLLVPRGASSSQRRSDLRFWVWPLPPAGSLKLGCEWPAMDIPFTVHEVDTSPILEGAARSEKLWDEPEGDGPAISAWTGYSGR